MAASLLQYALSGLTVGSIYAVVAVGFSLIYGTTGILNFAQGEFVMLGGMTAVTLSRFAPVPVAVAGAVLVVALFGGGLELALFRRLRAPSIQHMIMITIGLSIVIQELALHLWDEQARALPCFTGDECSALRFAGAALPPQSLWVLGTVAVAVLGLQAFLRYTLVGTAMRACASNAEAAQLAGIHTARLRTLAFALSAGLGALGGCVICPLSMTQYDIGPSLAIKGFAAAMLGGLGSPAGAVLGGLLVGLAESFSVSVLPAAYKDATAFAILLAVLFVCPRGLLRSRRAAAPREC